MKRLGDFIVSAVLLLALIVIGSLLAHAAWTAIKDTWGDAEPLSTCTATERAYLDACKAFVIDNTPDNYMARIDAETAASAEWLESEGARVEKVEAE